MTGCTQSPHKRPTIHLKDNDQDEVVLSNSWMIPLVLLLRGAMEASPETRRRHEVPSACFIPERSPPSIADRSRGLLIA